MERQLTYIEAINEAMDQAMERDESVFVLGEDVGRRGGVFRATDGLYMKYGASRVIDSPLAESAIVGVGVGAAMYGMRPIAEIQFADFIMPAVNQIVSEAAKIRYRSNNAWSCPLVVRAPFGGGIHGALYHSQSVEALFAGTPGLRIVIPSTPYTAKGLLLSAIESDDPVLFFEHKRAYRMLKGIVPNEPYTLDLTCARTVCEGDDLTIMTYGLCVHFAELAVEKLREEGISVHLVDLQTVYPLDQRSIIDAAKRTGKVLLVTEDNKEGSVMSEVSAIIAEHCLFDLDAPIERLAAPDVPLMPYASPQEKFVLITEETIAARARALAQF
ncbi:MAG: alpha-ketoacid dehydrogenase subunit beta [Bacilli bacterium]